MRLTVLSFLHSLTHEVDRILWKPMFGNRTGNRRATHDNAAALHASQSVRRVHALLRVEARVISNLKLSLRRPRMELATLRELFVHELKDLYSAENMIIKALPKMAKAASSEELRSAFEEHLEQTTVHVERLQQIFENLDESPKGKTCKGMEALI